MPTYDRLTINWTGERGIAMANKFRTLVGSRSLNRVLKELVERYVKEKEQEAQEKTS